MNRQNPAQTFLQEAEDLLGQIEEITLEVQPDAPVGESIHRLFRAFHTIKGSGAMFGFDTVAAFTHHVETVLDKVRDGLVPVSRELIDLLLAARDQIKLLLESAQTGAAVPTEKGDRIIARLNALLPSQALVAPIKKTPASANTGALEVFKIHFRPAADVMASGTNPALLLDELRALGACTVTAHTETVPTLELLQPDQCYLAWDITLTTDKGLNAIKDVFIFVEDTSKLVIQPAGTPPPTADTPAPCATPVLAPASTPANVSPAAPATASAPVTLRKLSARDAVVRVPSERLDRLVNLVGELVMNQSRLSQLALSADVPSLSGPVEELERLVDELRDNVLGIRMMPIGTTFSRFKRLVHDLSAELGKEIELVTEGAETELDKTVLDQLGDPLVHVIRNSIGHGIELPADRERAGKPRHGTIRLTASHVGSNVVITIEDDGKGIDVEAVRAKALEKKLISPSTNLTEKEVLDLIFLPGFSTAKQVTNVSGRGVGMDVVKRQFDALRGQISMSTNAGKGTKLTLTLPLTLAIIDGLLVEISQDQFIVPMSIVTENVELHRSERGRLNGRNVIPVRGELIPYVHLREAFAMPGEEPEIEKIVIVRHGNERVGFVVDRVLGSHQTVIQSLGRFYRDINIVSGTTIMGDGRVALILDVAGIVAHASQQPKTTTNDPTQKAFTN